MPCRCLLLHGHFYTWLCLSPLTFPERVVALKQVHWMETHMGKNQHWFTYPHLVTARIPSGSRLSPVITWKFDCLLLHHYYTTISLTWLLPLFALASVEE